MAGVDHGSLESKRRGTPIERSVVETNGQNSARSWRFHEVDDVPIKRWSLVCFAPVGGHTGERACE
jgi:hypothetical protein